MFCVRDSNLTKSSVCIPNQLKLIGIFLPWHAAGAGSLEDVCVSVSSSFSVFCPKTYLHIVFLCTYIHIIIHAARLYGGFPQSSEQPPLRGQGSSMHQGQDVSRKLLSHNGATSSETFVQIYKNLFELQIEWGSGGDTWLDSSAAARQEIHQCLQRLLATSEAAFFNRAWNCLRGANGGGGAWRGRDAKASEICQ